MEALEYGAATALHYFVNGLVLCLFIGGVWTIASFFSDQK